MSVPQGLGCCARRPPSPGPVASSVLALAERAWHRAPWEPAYRAGASYSYQDGKVDRQALGADWATFAARMPLQLRSLEQAGISYRLAPPGARIVDGSLQANSEFPGQTIEYKTDASGWTRYTGPVRARGKVKLRTRTFDGRRTSRMVEITAS